jgi:hypothetical protein
VDRDVVDCAGLLVDLGHGEALQAALTQALPMTILQALPTIL